ncbi:hypothetical protein [Geothrix alkalitolerans]|uniref:hypothetical protein n=1 Tax=Geothrix alkalitolerans TaxID=2922724 RepID=UPI001FAFA6D3|nr:hypothetical protein [Geothrix alkalitolerans]
MEWIALKHALLAHLPVATGLLLPWALFASQRAGRGMRPWWTVCRYLGWVGLLGLIAALVSGPALGRLSALIPAGRIFPLPASGLGADALLFRHAVIATAAALLSVPALWSMNRPRKDHQSLGLLALLLGLAWSGALLATGYSGYALAHPGRPVAPSPAKVVQAPPAPPADPEAQAPVRALDYASLEAIHAEPVKSPAHGGRWIRAWANPAAASAYRAGNPLPPGSLVVLSTLEDRWGRPGTEPGPLYALEMRGEMPALTFYWPQVPIDRRQETGGEARAYWRNQNTHLEACKACHTGGMADPAQRSRWRVPRARPVSEN